MVTLALTLAACSPSRGSAPEPEAPAPRVARGRVGSHGMVVIGEAKLLFHHLALYRTPHDRQILTPAVFASDADRAAFEAWRRDYEGLVTVVPEQFDLDRLAPGAVDPLTHIVADIYEGHFERGGSLAFPSVEFWLSAPVLHRPVKDDVADAPCFTYLVHGSRAYLVRTIGPRPGTDHILAVHPSPSVTSGECLNAQSQDLSADPLRFERDDRSVVELRAMGTLYLETSDFR